MRAFIGNFIEGLAELVAVAAFVGAILLWAHIINPPRLVCVAYSVENLFTDCRSK